MSIIKNLKRKKTIKNESPVALCFFFDGKFDSELAKLGIRLFGPANLSVYGWNPLTVHSNIQHIPIEHVDYFEYDFIIFNSIIDQREYINKYPKFLHLPSICLNHEPYSETNYHLQQRLMEAQTQLIYTEYGRPESILYGVDTEIANEFKYIPALIAGNFQNNNYGLLHNLTSKIENLVVFGHNPGLEFGVVPTDYDQYRDFFNRCKVYVNLPTQETINYEVLWAMAGGANVVTIRTPLFEQLAKDLQLSSLFLCENIEHLVETTKEKIEAVPDPEDAIKIKNKFSYNKFKVTWKHIIEKTSNRVYTHESTNRFE